jgi:hypothetical protein
MQLLRSLYAQGFFNATYEGITIYSAKHPGNDLPKLPIEVLGKTATLWS